MNEGVDGRCTGLLVGEGDCGVEVDCAALFALNTSCREGSPSSSKICRLSYASFSRSEEPIELRWSLESDLDRDAAVVVTAEEVTEADELGNVLIIRIKAVIRPAYAIEISYG